MAADKSVMQAPLGMEALAANEAPIEIEIEDPESVAIGMDGVVVELMKREPRADDFDANLAEFIDENELQSLAGELL